MMQSTLETLQNIIFMLVNTSEKVTCNQKYHASHWVFAWEMGRMISSYKYFYIEKIQKGTEF